MNIRQIRNRIFTFAKPERQTISQSSGQLKHSRVASLFACLPRFLFRCYPPHMNIHFTEERYTCEGYSTAWCLLLIQTNQASVGHFACRKQWRNEGCTAQSRKFDPKTTKKTTTTTTTEPILRLGAFGPSKKNIETNVLSSFLLKWYTRAGSGVECNLIIL